MCVYSSNSVNTSVQLQKHQWIFSLFCCESKNDSDECHVCPGVTGQEVAIDPRQNQRTPVLFQNGDFLYS